MKFTVSIDDFWLEDDEDLAPALKAHVIREVIHKISKDIKEKVEEQITKKVQEVMDDKMNRAIDDAISSFLATGLIKVNHKEVPIETHLKNVFQSNHGWNNPTDQLRKIAKRFGEELKNQYNVVFANEIVRGIKDQGLLKDEVVQLLLNKPTN